MAPLSCLMSLLTCAVLAVHHHHCCCHHLPPLTQSHPSPACPSSLLLLCAWVLPLLLAWHHLQLPSWQQVPFSLLTLCRTKAADSRAGDNHVWFVMTYRLSQVAVCVGCIQSTLLLLAIYTAQRTSLALQANTVANKIGPKQDTLYLEASSRSGPYTSCRSLVLTSE